MQTTFAPTKLAWKLATTVSNSGLSDSTRRSPMRTGSRQPMPFFVRKARSPTTKRRKEITRERRAPRSPRMQPLSGRTSTPSSRGIPRRENPTLIHKPHIPHGMMLIRLLGASKRWSDVSRSSLTGTSSSLAATTPWRPAAPIRGSVLGERGTGVVDPLLYAGSTPLMIGVVGETRRHRITVGHQALQHHGQIYVRDRPLAE